MSVYQYAQEIYFLIEFGTPLETCDQFWEDLMKEKGLDYYLLVLKELINMMQNEKRLVH